ncbi:MAG: CHASE2 domain-containing protein [Cyclobacteriaceae bacterium]
MKTNLIFLIALFNCGILFGQKILVVDIGHQNRIEVGRALSIISSHHPRIIGIDALYVADSLQRDTVLISSIKKGNVVMAAQLHYRDAPYPFWDSLELPHDKFLPRRIGFSHIYTDDGKPVLEIPIYESYKGKLLPSFSYQVAQGAKPGFRLDLRSIRIDESDISGDYPMVSLTDIIKGKFENEDVENQIVLLGYAGQQLKIGKRSTKDISRIQVQASFIDYILKRYSN